MSLPHITICDCVTERTGQPHVTISSAQHEALMAAAALTIQAADQCKCGVCDDCATARALRAAGIDLEDE